MPELALHKDFLTAFSELPKPIQRKVNDFLGKFRADSTRASLHLEPIHDMRDAQVRTARIDQKYRAVLLSPEKGDTFVAVWVDNHDEAMAWAKGKRFDVNPTTGAWQVVDVVAAEQVKLELEKNAPPSIDESLFAYIDDEGLLLTGLPVVFLAALRLLRTVEQLEGWRQYLPEETYEALFYISEGASVQEAIGMARITLPAKAVDVTDVETALLHPDSLRRVKVVTSDDELADMLNAPLEQWRIFLHPAQAEWVKRNFNGPARVLGGAGTGKTVVAMHRARHLAKNVFPTKDDLILFLTFSPNLARNIAQNLDLLCGVERERIVVHSLHSWAFQLLKDYGITVYTFLDTEVKALWEQALTYATTERYGIDFYRIEWTNVIRANNIQTLEEYLTVRRVGQGTTLNRAERLQVWQVLNTYKNLLAHSHKVEISDLPLMALDLIRTRGLAFPYRAVVVDEVQDLSPIELQLIRAIVPPAPNDIFLVGDGHQRIYNTVPAPLTAWGIRIIGRSRKLYVNYRTTEYIRRWASQVLADVPIDDLDGNVDSVKGYVSLRNGEPPTIQHFSTREAEMAFIIHTIEALVFEQDVESQTLCVVARTTAHLNRYQKALTEAQIPILYLKAKTRDDESEGVRLATMHRVKGLEFNHVFIVGVNDNVIPAPQVLANDPQALMERCLLHVAATRARDSLTITSWGTPSSFLKRA